MGSNSLFKKSCENYILKNNLFKPTKNSIYTIAEILDVIEYILVTGSSWRSLKLSVFGGKYKWESIYYHFNKFSVANVFQNIYFELLDDYFKTNMSSKLKYISTDTSFVKNQYASDAKYNGYCKKKKLSKISFIVDSFGVILSVVISSGNVSDQTLLFENISECLVDINYTSNNNKYTRYFLADSIYDTDDIHEKIKSLNIIPIIAYNKRNTKDESIIRAKQLSNHHKIIYKKRIIIENVFSWVYKNRRTSCRYDKKVINYMSFLYMALIKIILKRL